MQPTPEPTPAPSSPDTPGAPVVAEQLDEFVRADRQRSAFILLGLSAVLFALCGWSSVSAYLALGPPEEKI